MTEPIPLFSYTHCNEKKVMPVHLQFWNKCCHMAIQSHCIWLVIGYARTSIPIVVQSNDAAFIKSLLIRSNKIFISIITFLCRNQRNIPKFQRRHIILIPFFGDEKIC